MGAVVSPFGAMKGMTAGRLSDEAELEAEAGAVWMLAAGSDIPTVVVKVEVVWIVTVPGAGD